MRHPLTLAERRFLAGGTKGPHPDERILHEPGVCQWCDQWPFAQRLRVMWGVRFTAQVTDPTEKGTLTCPAEARHARAQLYLNRHNLPSIARGKQHAKKKKGAKTL